MGYLVGLSKETRSSSFCNRDIRTKFVYIWRFMVLIRSFKSLISALSISNSYFNSLTVIDFEKGDLFFVTYLRLKGRTFGSIS